MSLCMRKPTICMGENKDADQLRGNREADQLLCFRYTDSTFPPLLIPKFSRFWVSSVTVQAGLCWTWSETQIVGFVMHRLILPLHVCLSRQSEKSQQIIEYTIVRHKNIQGNGVRKLGLGGISDQSDTNQAVQSEKTARSVRLRKRKHCTIYSTKKRLITCEVTTQSQVSSTLITNYFFYYAA